MCDTGGEGVARGGWRADERRGAWLGEPATPCNALQRPVLTTPVLTMPVLTMPVLTLPVLTMAVLTYYGQGFDTRALRFGATYRDTSWAEVRLGLGLGSGSG